MLERDQHLESLIQCNALYRRFLRKWILFGDAHKRDLWENSVHGRINACRHLRKHTQTHAPHFFSAQFLEDVRGWFGDEESHNIIQEQSHYALFVDVFAQLHEWKRIKSIPRPSNSVNPMEMQVWTRKLLDQTQKIEVGLRQLLQMQGYSSWLQDDPSKPIYLPSPHDTGSIYRVKQFIFSC